MTSAPERASRRRRGAHWRLGGAATIAGALAIAVGLVALAGCGPKAPSVGIARVDKTTVIAFKPCGGDRKHAGIGRMDVYGSDQPDKAVWSAVHIDGQPATLDLPIVRRYPGYDIVDERPDNHLDRNQRYSVEAVAVDGTAWGGPGFRPGDVASGRVRVAGRVLRFSDWVDEPASCPNVTLLGALLTGIVVAAVAGGSMIAARGVRRATRTARRAP